MGNLKSLTELQLRGTKVKRLPDSIGNLKNIKVLKLCRSAVLELPNDLWNLEKLEVLDALDCRKLKGEIPDDIGKLSNLRVLDLESTKIRSISESICSLNYLNDFNLTGVRLESLPDLPSSLRTLSASYLSSAKLLYLLKLTNLKSLYLDHVYEVRCSEVRISLDILKLSKLETVYLRCFDTSTLPQEIGSLPRLQKLSLRHFDNVKRLPSLPSGLIELEVHDFKSLDILGDLSNLKNLTKLLVSKCPSLETIQGLSSLASLRDLNLRNSPGLVTLDGLEGLADLSNLKNLKQIVKRRCKEFEIHGIDRDVCKIFDWEWEGGMETEDDESEDVEIENDGAEDNEIENDEAEDDEIENDEAEDDKIENDEAEDNEDEDDEAKDSEIEEDKAEDSEDEEDETEDDGTEYSM